MIFTSLQKLGPKNAPCTPNGTNFSKNYFIELEELYQTVRMSYKRRYLALEIKSYGPLKMGKIRLKNNQNPLYFLLFCWPSPKHRKSPNNLTNQLFIPKLTFLGGHPTDPTPSLQNDGAYSTTTIILAMNQLIVLSVKIADDIFIISTRCSPQ